MLAVQADVENIDELDKLVPAIDQHLNDRVDVLFINASMGNFASIADITPAL